MLPAGYGSNSGSTAVGAVTLALASNPADWSTLSTHESIQSVEGLPGPGMIFGPASSASISISYSQSVIAPGPERVGYLQIRGDNFTGAGGAVDGELGMISGFALPPVIIDESTVITQITCGSQGCTPGAGYYGHYSLIPVTLGTPLTLVANGFVTNQARDGEGTTSAYLDTEFQFRFFEVDESTPVPVQALSEVPEPSTAAMLLIPALAFGFFRVRRQQA